MLPSRFQTSFCLPRPSSVALPSLTPGRLAYIQVDVTATFGSSTSVWLPLKFGPTKHGAGPLRPFGTTINSRNSCSGRADTEISRRVALPPNAFGSSSSTLAVTVPAGGMVPYM
jgi:hypothetical protein